MRCEECGGFVYDEKHVCEMTVTKKMRTVSVGEFGIRIARVFNESRSSTAVFFMQQAFKDCDDDNGMYWEAFQAMLDRFETQQSAPDGSVFDRVTR